MNNQMPYQFMPAWQNPNFPGNWPNQPSQPNLPGRCNCREQLNQVDNRINRLERQVRRLENRVTRLERGFPVPLTANANNDQDFTSYQNEQDYSSYQSGSGMYMM